MFLHVIARSEATWQSALLRQYITKSNTLGEYEKHCEFALSTTDMSGISAGTRIATPVCALARNDMLKTDRCQRVQGRLPPVIARSEATRQSALLAAVHNEEQYFGRIRKAL